MNPLFDTDESGNVVTAVDKPSREVVCLLEGFGYKPEAVRQWSAVKANTVLHTRRKEDAIAVRRAEAVAREQEQDATVARGQPTQIERWEAAAALRRALPHGVDELHMAVVHTVYALNDDELKSLAEKLIATFRGKKS